MLFKDTCNRESNQQNLGTIKSSNLCTEIIEYSSPTETAVCNLSSIALPRFVREKVSYTKILLSILLSCGSLLYLLIYSILFLKLQGVPMESHPCKLVGSRSFKNRYFDFDKLAEVLFLNLLIMMCILFS